MLIMASSSQTSHLSCACYSLVQAVTSALQGAGRSLSDTGGLLLDLVVDESAERCVAVVRQLKGITATYRMTSKGPPTRHSHYVTGGG